MSTPPLRLVETAQDRQKALDAAVTQIERAFGKGAIMKLGGGGEIPAVESISTGSLGLDIALGIGGVPKGRVIEVYGPESSGKTTLTLHVIAQAQKAGGVCAFIDAEHAWLLSGSGVMKSPWPGSEPSARGKISACWF
jgi:recombination protein RecA